MTSLFLTIALTVSLFIIFRYFKKFKINSFYAVVVNYYVCVITGILFLNNFNTLSSINFSFSWVKLGLFTGSLFVPAFYLMALTVEKVNVSMASVANKMSLIMPVLFGFIFLNHDLGHFSIINMGGILLALASIVMTSIKSKEEGKSDTKNRYIFLLPVIIFLMGGIIDTLISYTNHSHLTPKMHEVFPIIMFIAASTTGALLILIKNFFYKEKIKLKDIAAGIILGVPNYFCTYLLIKTLSEFDNNTAIVFPVLNITVIIFASLLAVVLFNEKLSKLNLLGIALSVISIILVFN